MARRASRSRLACGSTIGGSTSAGGGSTAGARSTGGATARGAEASGSAGSSTSRAVTSTLARTVTVRRAVVRPGARTSTSSAPTGTRSGRAKGAVPTLRPPLNISAPGTVARTVSPPTFWRTVARAASRLARFCPTQASPESRARCGCSSASTQRARAASARAIRASARTSPVRS